MTATIYKVLDDYLAQYGDCNTHSFTELKERLSTAIEEAIDKVYKDSLTHGWTKPSYAMLAELIKIELIGDDTK